MSYKQITHTTKKSLFKRLNFSLTEKNNYLRLTWCDEKGQYHQRYTNYKDDKKNDLNRGKSEISQLVNAFGGPKEFNSLFGTVAQGFKRCVPGLFHWDNPMIDKCLTTGKLDFSSHFPACACGTLPDANTIKTVKGIVEPNEEYPFAFYLTSGFCAEYNPGEDWVYNTHDLMKTVYKNNILFSEDRHYPVNPNNYNDNETTILMKASKAELTDEMAKYYFRKLNSEKGSKERDEAKLVLLKIVGQMEMNDRNMYSRRPYAHLAAIIKARAIFKMLKLIDQIGGYENVIQVIVDGLIFDNHKKQHYGDDKEFLGSLKEEHFCDYGKFKGHNQYVIIDEDGVADICHAGYDINVDSTNFKEWKKSPSMNIKDNIQKKLKLFIEEL